MSQSGWYLVSILCAVGSAVFAAIGVWFLLPSALPERPRPEVTIRKV